MPNHITNKLYLNGDSKRIEELKNYIINAETGEVDFNVLEKMPEEYLDDDRWYDWRIEHWGTKWNAYETEVNGDVITFLTAWSGVPAMVGKLAAAFSDMKIIYDYADEDFGYNCGEYIYDGLYRMGRHPEPGSEEAMNFAAEVLGYDPREDEEWLGTIIA